MASGFPGSIDNFTDPLSNSPLNSPSHSTLHSDVNDAVEKIETYMGLVKVIPTSVTGGTLAANGTITIGTAVSSVVVSGAFSSLYDNYKIIVDGGTASTGASFNLQFGSTTSGYHYAGIYNQYSASTPLGLATQVGASFVEAGRTSTTGNSMNVEVFGPFLSQRTGYRSNSTDYNTVGFLVNAAGFLNDTTSYTAFTVKPTSGTITGGTIRVYGYRN